MRLQYTQPALADLDRLLDYISARSPQGATRVHARLQAAVNILLLHPRIGTPTNDPRIRRMTATPYPYLIFYEPTSDEIVIHAVRHSARDPENMPGRT